MKIIYVYGHDYAAMEFEKKFDTEAKLTKKWNALKKKGGSESTGSGGDDEVTIVAVEYKGSVDINFLQFLRDELLDYDNCKDRDFFVVEND